LSAAFSSGERARFLVRLRASSRPLRPGLQRRDMKMRSTYQNMSVTDEKSCSDAAT
jgi:hypothetical protein